MDVINRGLLIADRQNLDTVRALHQTVVSLRTALDKSRDELKELRAKFDVQVDAAVYEDTIEKLSIENHILRQRVIGDGKLSPLIEQLNDIPKVNLEPSEVTIESMDSKSESAKKSDEKVEPDKSDEMTRPQDNNGAANVEKEVCSGTEVEDTPKNDVTEKDVEGFNGDESTAHCNSKEMKRGESDENDQSFQSETSQPDLQGNKNVVESDNDSEELDDIELIFTTDETKELGVLQEDLVSFSDNEGWQTGTPQVTVKFHEDSFDEAAENDVEEKNNVTDKIQFNLKTWTHSVLVETDISKCGVIDENEAPARIGRRNTLPNPLMYQPIIHRDAMSGNRGQSGVSPVSPRPGVKFFPSNRSPRNGNLSHGKSPVRPILVERNSAKRESEAQTDITALPSHWKSESYLAHKVSHNFTTLPSKFTLPIQQISSKYSLKLSDKTQEARRTLLSDINFTSMVPELSRSADHLCRAGRENCSNLTPCKGYSRPHSYMKSTTENLVSPGYFHSRDYGKDMWSPCECGQSNLMQYSRVRSSWDAYQPPRYRGSLTSMPSYDYTDSKRRHSSSAWRDSPEMYRSHSMGHRPSYGSVPSSPTHSIRSRSVPFSPSYSSSRNDVFAATPSYLSASRDSAHFCLTSKNARIQPPTRSRARNRVTFHESSFRRSAHPGQSLPDLRADYGPESGDSTDSLIDEAEEYLRRSIDSILTGADWGRVGQRRQNRRHSDPDPIREFVPPKSAQPFLPKVPRDLKLDHLVKVITGEGRVTVGRVRYVGTVQAGTEPYVGVELPRDSGNCDGSYQGRRYFDCDPDHGIFVPFKKVVMGWSF